MAYNIIRPRRGIKSMWDQFKSRVYKQGEMLVESPESGVGTGPVNIKFGDGVSSYENLPYAVQAPTDELTENGTAPMTARAGFSLKKLIEAIDVSGLAAKSHKHTKSEITDFPTSMPASDVSAWAKASAKPTYTKSEVGLGNVDNTADSAKSVKYATTAGTANAVAWANVSSKPSSFTPSSHNQAASTITAGTFAGDVVAKASTAYTTAKVLNGVVVPKASDPGEGGSTSYPAGTIVFVRKN